MHNLVNNIFITFISIFYYNTHSMDALVNKTQEVISAPYISCKQFDTEHVKFERINSAQQEIDSYNAIYNDSGFRNSWFMDVPWMSFYSPDDLLDEETITLMKGRPLFSTDHALIRKLDIEYFQKKEKLSFYRLPASFADYSVYDKKTQEIVGRFIFKNREKKGRIETGIYILKKFRKNGLGVEIMSGIFKNVIDPAIGKPFVISYCFKFEEPFLQPENFETNTYHDFQGVFGTVAPWYNYPSVSISHKAGCALRWEEHLPSTFYPIRNESIMSQSDVGYFMKVIKTLFMFGINEEELLPEELFPAFKHVEGDFNKEDPLIQNLYSLLHTEEYDTFISTIEALTFMGEGKEDLRGAFFPGEVRNLLSKNKNFLLDKHKVLFEYLSKDEVILDKNEDEHSESDFENIEEDIIQISKKRPLSSPGMKKKDIRPKKRSKEDKGS